VMVPLASTSVRRAAGYYTATKRLAAS
jgi:hypothetical protein